MNIKFVLALGLLGLGDFAWAQGCPSGIPSAGNPGCIPPDQQHSPYYQGNQGSAPQVPQVRWATRWGAIAVDKTNGGVGIGTIIGMRSKRQATKTALAACRAKGGKKCEVELTYYNQCGVIIWGDNGFNTASAATISEARQVGMQTCNVKDVNCQVYYAECSPPERIQ